MALGLRFQPLDVSQGIAANRDLGQVNAQNAERRRQRRAARMRMVGAGLGIVGGVAAAPLLGVSPLKAAAFGAQGGSALASGDPVSAGMVGLNLAGASEQASAGNEAMGLINSMRTQPSPLELEAANAGVTPDSLLSPQERSRNSLLGLAGGLAKSGRVSDAVNIASNLLSREQQQGFQSIEAEKGRAFQSGEAEKGRTFRQQLNERNITSAETIASANRDLQKEIANQRATLQRELKADEIQAAKDRVAQEYELRQQLERFKAEYKGKSPNDILGELLDKRLKTGELSADEQSVVRFIGTSNSRDARFAQIQFPELFSVQGARSAGGEGVGGSGAPTAASARQQANAAIAAGADEDTVKKRFKDKYGEDL